MGNCLETCSYGRQGVEKQHQQHQHEEELKGGDLVKEDGFGKGGYRVKIVLTKEELGWLMCQLNENEGRRLEDVLEELEKGRGKAQGWKPSLESIMESPELHEMDR